MLINLVWLIIFTCISLTVTPASADDAAGFKRARDDMVRYQIKQRGIRTQKVLSAMTAVPRHIFVPHNLKSRAYDDQPLPIGEGQTISQPYVVALMTDSLNLEKDARVLEIGTGSGYQAAVLSKIVAEVYTVEIKKGLFERSTEVLRSQNFRNVNTRHGDGYYGWEKHAPFDAIMITAAVDHIPPPLLGQLKDGGRLILPLGNPFSYQNLVLVKKNNKDFTIKQITGVLFVPMTGTALKIQK